jgi:hypothetical protein
MPSSRASGVTTHDDVSGAPPLHQERCQNLSTMPTSNVTSESVLDDSTPPI